MKKAYIQPEAEILSLASLDDFLVGSTGSEAGDGFVGDGDDWDDDWT
ncbi:MAG: hypothetical protein IIW94_00245 [Clostridia bacterium]|nr:hypothetical protein [Clostridia bacterium]